MTYEELLASVDRIRFRTACATLIDEELARALCEAIYSVCEQDDDALRMLLRLFQDLPLYSVIASAVPLLPLLSRPVRGELYAVLSAALDRERSAAADAVETLLFADLFADPASVDEVWGALALPGASETALRSVLRVSAPVPWRLKRTLFARLLPDSAWHGQLLLALRGARLSLHGSTLDPEEALLVVDRLVLPDRAAEVESVRRVLTDRPLLLLPALL
jgi:hypothetical protein